MAANSLQTVLDQQEKILEKLPEKDVDTVYKALKQYVDKYEEVLKETLEGI
jgi:DNA-binding GntR family transcriptional regulator